MIRRSIVLVPKERKENERKSHIFDSSLTNFGELFFGARWKIKKKNYFEVKKIVNYSIIMIIFALNKGYLLRYYSYNLDLF